MKVRVIVAEKNSVARKIACSICKIPCEDKRSCKFQHEDIFIHSFYKQRSSENNQSDVPINCVTHEANMLSFYYHCNERHCNKNYCRHFPCHLDVQGKTHSSQIKRKIKDLSFGENANRFGVEYVKYFEFQDKEWRTIILSTNGTIYNINVIKTKRESIPDKIVNTPDWEKINKDIRYLPKRSYFFINLLIKAILAEECRGKVDQIIFATDYDIAGSFIALSILEKAQADRKLRRKKEIDESKVKRMILKMLTQTEILNELNALHPFDWWNAYAGKLRTTFDFFFGKPLTQIMQKSIRKNISQGEDLRLSIGRVQLPALFLVINRDWEIGFNKNTYNIYFLIKGYFSKADLKSSIKERNLVIFLTKERKDHYSKSQFLLDLSYKKIGTHTTRLKRLSKLENSGLIEFDENQRICSTEMGLQYYNLLRNRLKTEQIDFASMEFNDKLYDDLEILKSLGEISEKDNIHQICKKMFNKLMNFYYKNIIELIPKFQNESEKIAPLLADYIPVNEEKKYGKKKNYHEEKKEIINLPLRLKTEECIPIEYLDLLVDDNGRYKKPEKDEILVFYRKFRKTNLLALLRLLLRIPRDTNFTICDMYQKKNIESFNEDNSVVFKTQIPDNLDVNCDEKFNSVVGNLKSLQFNPPITKLIIRKKIEFAHEPLHTTNLKHRDIPGKPGKKLVREYDRPYIYTIRKLLALSKEKEGLIDGFKVENLKFHCIDPYEPFKAHNYESMLFTMYEKYHWDFDDTSKMMQKLYEGGGSY
jgi:DNA topoisomerase IA